MVSAGEGVMLNWEQHTGELLILVLAVLLMASLLILVPQLLRSHQRTQEMLHAEHMKALEEGQPLAASDVRSKVAGRMAALVPMIAVCSAATVTCFLAAYKSPELFSVGVAVWSVTGLISLAAITGGVALLGRIAQIEAGIPDEIDDDVERMAH